MIFTDMMKAAEEVFQFIKSNRELDLSSGLITEDVNSIITRLNVLFDNNFSFCYRYLDNPALSKEENKVSFFYYLLRCMRVRQSLLEIFSKHIIFFMLFYVNFEIRSKLIVNQTTGQRYFPIFTHCYCTNFSCNGIELMTNVLNSIYNTLHDYPVKLEDYIESRIMIENSCTFSELTLRFDSLLPVEKRIIKTLTILFGLGKFVFEDSVIPNEIFQLLVEQIIICLGNERYVRKN